MAMMAMTTSSSINVNARPLREKVRNPFALRIAGCGFTISHWSDVKSEHPASIEVKQSPTVRFQSGPVQRYRVTIGGRAIFLFCFLAKPEHYRHEPIW